MKKCIAGCLVVLLGLLWAVACPATEEHFVPVEAVTPTEQEMKGDTPELPDMPDVPDMPMDHDAHGDMTDMPLADEMMEMPEGMDHQGDLPGKSFEPGAMPMDNGMKDDTHGMPDMPDMPEGMDHSMGHDHEAVMKKAADQADQIPSADGPPVGLVEHLGQYLPQDAEFKDSTGNDVTLGGLITAPTLVLPVYYTCPNVCHILQSAVARILPQVNLEPGREINVLSISFDENDTPETAAKAKRNFAMAMGKGFPPENWTFLSGDLPDIHKTMQSMGFRFQRVGRDFAHPVIAVVVAPDGKIVRYLYGSDFLPFDLTMALTEAAQGKTGLSVKRLISYCFSYDPSGKRYVFNAMRVAGISVLVGIAVLLVFLLLAGKRKRR